MSSFSWRFQGSHLPWYLVVILVALIIGIWYYQRKRTHATSLMRGVLLALRLSTICIIGLLLLEPLVGLTGEQLLGRRLGVLIDISASMNLQERGKARWQIADSLLQASLPRGIKMQFYGFADSLVELAYFPDSARFVGQATDIARALASHFGDVAEDLGGLLLISDGAANIGQDPVAVASRLDLPVYTLAVGEQISRRDVFVADVDYPLVAYTNTAVTVRVRFGAVGYSGQRAMLEIRDGRQTLFTQHVILPADGAVSEAEFKLMVSEDGAKTLKAIISRFPDEFSSENNVRPFVVKFLKSKIRVLILAARLNWELTFLNRLLSGNPHFDVTTILGDSRGRFISGNLPSSPDGWTQFDLVIVIDTPARSLGQQLASLKIAVKNKSGFLYIAGSNSEKAALSDWGELLPFRPSSNTTLLGGQFFPVPSPGAKAASVIEIEGMQWEQLPPLQFVLYPLQLADGSWTIMEVFSSDGKRLPILLAGSLGTTKKAAIVGFPWWPRTFRAGLDATETEQQKRFWSNLAYWLVTPEDLAKFNLSLQKPVYKLGEPINFSATLFDDNYQPKSGGRIRVAVVDSVGAVRELLLVQEDAGRYSGSISSLPAGEYRYQAVATFDSDTLGQRAGNFVVESASLEMENPIPNYGLLRRIAEITGAKSYTASNFSEFASDLKLKSRRIEVSKEYRPLGNPWLLGLVVVLLSLEWGIRKYGQLP